MGKEVSGSFPLPVFDIFAPVSERNPNEATSKFSIINNAIAIQ